MDKNYELYAFIERTGKLEPFFLRISPPIPAEDDAEFYCNVHAATLMTHDVKIFGVDADQARELALQFVKSLLGNARLVDKDCHPIEW